MLSPTQVMLVINRWLNIHGLITSASLKMKFAWKLEIDAVILKAWFLICSINLITNESWSRREAGVVFISQSQKGLFKPLHLRVKSSTEWAQAMHFYL